MFIPLMPDVVLIDGSYKKILLHIKTQLITFELRLSTIFHLVLRLYLTVSNLCSPLCCLINKSELTTVKTQIKINYFLLFL